jgi:DNA repair protein RecN (Recombination protein N)
LIKRLYLRELVGFDEVELEFDQGLVVLTGPSGAGKSVLISSILSSFGYSALGTASLCEVTLQKPTELQSEFYALEEEVTLKTLKKDKVRSYLDGQNISKKTLAELFAPYVQYLSVRDKGGFESTVLLELIDSSLDDKNPIFKKLLKEYKKRYVFYKIQAERLKKIKEDETKLAELIEFAVYEIEKIERINPRIDEEEELMQIKQQLSKIDKIKDALQNANELFAYEASVEEVYRLLNKDVSVFSEAMNQLRSDFEEAQTLADELEEVDIEKILDRLGDLNGLKNRYGSIREALNYKEQKKEELAGYKNSEQNKSALESFLAREFSELHRIAKEISVLRQEEAKSLQNALDVYLQALKLPSVEFIFENTLLCESGVDRADIMLGGSKTATLSGGEFNRMRLALMAVCIDETKQTQGVLILDEIDANVSGDESIAIAQMIAKLSKAYQVFAISHQPHLSAQARQHILVTKEGTKSRIKELDEEERVKEIARIIGGENPTPQALAFAKKLRNA